MNARRLLPALAAAAAVAPVWSWAWRRTWDPSGEPWGILALALAALFAGSELRATEHRDDDPTDPRRFPEPLALAALLLGIHAVVVGRVPPLLAAIPAAAAVGFAILHALPVPRRALHIPALLVLALPLGPSLQFYLGLPLRLASGTLAALLLRSGGLDATARGTGLVVGGHEVFVDPACSGARMLWGALLLALALAGSRRLAPGRLAALATAAVVASLLGNAWRSAALALAEARLAGGLSDSQHEAVGLVVFATIAWMLSSLAARASAPSRRSTPCPA